MINYKFENWKTFIRKQDEKHNFPNRIVDSTVIENANLFGIASKFEKLKIAVLIDEKMYSIEELEELLKKAKKENCRIYINFGNEFSQTTLPIGFYLIKPIDDFEIGYSAEEIKEILEERNEFFENSQ
ncbi:MAG: hypothetical protein WC356_06335 [Candidatus Micrarchaeia archaeon]|jgi:hypothetical protein